jgi:RES domain-containing protein
MIAFRACKVRYDPFDASGAALHGGRWNSPGHPVIYAADSFAGSLLEVLAHSMRPRTLPGAHHALQLDIPDALIEVVEEGVVPRWHEPDSPEARDFGDRWITEARTVALSAPSLPARPVGRVVLLNPAHPDLHRIVRGEPFPVPWDDRLL